MYRSLSNSSEDINHLSQFLLNFSVDRKVILIEDFNLPLINWGNAHPCQDDFESSTQAFVDVFVSSGSSQGLLNSHCPYVFDYVFEFSCE